MKKKYEEKIQIMEMIWDDLSQNAEALSSPDWHKNILNEREEQIKSGKTEFVDWEITKGKILEDIK